MIDEKKDCEYKIVECAIPGQSLFVENNSSRKFSTFSVQMETWRANDLANLKSDNIRLRAALEKYGQHITDGLPFFVTGHTDGACPASVNRGDCVCGFNKAPRGRE